MTIEERLAELENKFAAMSVAQQAAGDPSGYYTSIYSGEQIDAAIGNVLNVGNNPIAIKNIGAAPRRNLLDNWYFKGGGSQQGGGQFPINQRGQTSYGAGYGMDRWASNSCTVSIQSDGILISGGANYANLYKIIDNPSRFAGMTVTLSALILGGSGIGNGAYLNLQINGTDHVTYMLSQGLVSVTVKCPSQITNMHVAFVTSSLSGYSLQVIAAKLELGDHQTLAYQDESGNWQLFEIPDYAEELAKCQARLLILQNQTIPVTVFSKSVSGVIPTPVTMDEGAVPTVTLSGSAFLYVPSGTVGVDPSAYSGVSVQPNGVVFTGTAEVSSNVPGVLVVDKIIISREL